MAEPKYIRFVEGVPKAKTRVWAIVSIEGKMTLGWISWYGAWRKYTFCPNVTTVLEETCLRDIADFCEARTRDHKAALAEKRSNG